jgi:adenine-specific DNA-methyltransferase
MEVLYNLSKLEVSGRRKDSARLQWNSKPRRAINPRDIDFQTAEIVIPNPARDQSTITSFENLMDNVQLDKGTMNRLIWGDNLLSMQALLASGYEGKISLIYIDPPFWTGENYYSTFEIEKTEVTRAPSVIERLAYKDIWEGGIDSFLDMLYPRLQLMRRLLTDNGSIFVHLDYHVGHYVKLVMDEILGMDNFRNEIIVKRGRKKGLMYQFEKVDRMHTSNDSILWYTKSSTSKFKHPLSETEGVEAKWMGFWSNTNRPTMRYELFGRIPDRGQWKWEKVRASKAVENYRKFEREFNNSIASEEEYQKLSKEEQEVLKDKSLLEYWSENGQALEFIRYREGLKYPEYWVEPREHKLIDNLWTDIEAYNYSSDYPTEKHSELLNRVITNFSNEGDLVADFFAGSGTSAVVAEKLKRRWILCDFSKLSIQVTRNRLVQNETKPFLVENMGNYQRQLIYLGGSRVSEIQTIVLKLYGATPRKDYPDMGIRKVEDKTELVYVSYPDRPVTARKVEQLESLAEHLDGKGYSRLIILGWDYEYNYDEILRERQRASKRKWYSEIESKSIPLEVYEYLKRAKNGDNLASLEGKIQFYLKPYLKIIKPILEKASGKNWRVTIGIDKYVVFDYPVEKEEREKEIEEIVKDKPLSLIDYWAVDWNYDGKTFKSGWQAMRRMGNKIIGVPKYASKELEAKKLYTIAVRVVDVFGNDAASTVAVDLQGMS